METTGRYLSLFGPMIVGAVGTVWLIVAATALEGRKRLFVLTAGPAAIVAGMFLVMLFAKGLTAEGSGFLLEGVVFGLSLFGLSIYYPILFIVCIIPWLRRRNE